MSVPGEGGGGREGGEDADGGHGGSDGGSDGGFGSAWPTRKDTLSFGALPGVEPSKASAERSPVPVMTKTRLLPLAHPSRFTTSCTSSPRSGVPTTSPSASHGAMFSHSTDAEVSVRLGMSFETEKGGASSAACWQDGRQV